MKFPLVPYSQFTDQVAAESEGRPYTFNWKSKRRAYCGLSHAIDKQVAEAAVHSGDDLGMMLAIFSECERSFNHVTDLELFRELVRAQDLLFADYYKCLDWYKNVTTGSLFVDIGARWLAMNAPREVWSSALEIGRTATKKATRSLQGIPAGSLWTEANKRVPQEESLENGLPSSQREEILYKAAYIQANTGSGPAWHEWFKGMFTRYLLDLDHVRLIRNKFLHQNRFSGRTYYITLMMHLLKEVIVFRAQCHAAYSKLPALAKVRVDELAIRKKIEPTAAAFALGIHGIVLDSKYALKLGGRCWLSDKNRAVLYGVGWGGWCIGGLTPTLTSKAYLAKTLSGYHWKLFEDRSLEARHYI